MAIFQKSAWLVPGICLVVVSGIPSKASGIPYFARKYRTTCSRCHIAVPKLNTFGKNFQMHGYQQPGDRPVNKLEFPEDKNLSLLDQVPVGFLVENNLALDRAAGNQNANSFNSSAVFHIFAADTIAPDMGFFGELATQGGVTDVGKVSLIFSHLGNQNIFGQVGNLDLFEHGVTEHDLYGRNGFGIQDIGLSNLGGAYALSPQHMGVRLYGLIGSKVTPSLFQNKPSTGDAKADDSRPMRLAQKGKAKKSDDDMQEEADPMDSMTGFLWEVGIYNSTNLNAPPPLPVGSPTPVGPNPSDYAARINMYFSGDSFVGIAGYSGLMSVVNVGTGQANRYRVAGPDFSYQFGKPFEKSKGMMIKPFNLQGGYLTGQADNPDPVNVGHRVSWKGYFAQLDYAPTPRSMAFLRYDKVDSNNLAALAPGTISEGITANYTFYPRTNFWIGVEYTHDLSPAKQDLLGVLFNFAF